MAQKNVRASGAKKTPSKRSATSSRASSTRKSEKGVNSLDVTNLKKFKKPDTQKIMKKVRNNPIALYLAGGVGAIFMARFAYRYYRNHPELKEIIKENFDTVEESLREYRLGTQDESAEARH